MAYINANLTAPDSQFFGADTRPRWTTGTGQCPTVAGGFNRVNCAVTSAIVLKNTGAGSSWNFSTSLEKPFGFGTYLKAAYSYGVAKTLVDPGSIASGSWTSNAIAIDPNNPSAGFAATSPGHRIFGAGSKRFNLFRIGGTTAALFWEARTIGNGSYTFSSDANGDGATNDLIYIPRDKSEMNFVTFTSGSTTFTPQQQADAWEAFIEQDKYLSGHRGQYAERNAVFLPMFNRADASIAQDIATKYTGRNSLQLRLDFLNLSNLVNHNWGVSQRFVTTTPLVFVGTDAQGAMTYRLQNVGSQLISHSFQSSALTTDVYRIQLTVRYLFQ